MAEETTNQGYIDALAYASSPSGSAPDSTHQEYERGINSYNLARSGEAGAIASVVTADTTNDRIGVNDTSPAVELSVKDGDSDGNAIIAAISGPAGQSQLWLGDTDDANLSQIAVDQTDNSMQFKTANAERARFEASGHLLVGKTVTTGGTVGASIYQTGSIEATVDANVCLQLDRLTDDGDLIQFFQDTTQEGSISVSGTTVSLNGAHLSRWSQLPSGDANDILRGTVLTNLDEMCSWPGEDNEQLNKTEVSSVVSDKNVAGVFQGVDKSDENGDFYVAMTGDFIIRIGADESVARGDLLESAGDGTAKSQADDIVKSSTVAKVTSTNVVCTYDDGSYCVPCVLMAC